MNPKSVKRDRPSAPVACCRAAAWLSVAALAVLTLIPKNEIDPLRDGYYGFGLTLEHTAAYAGTMMIAGAAYGTRAGLFRIGLALSLYGGLLEIGQHFSPGRTPQAIDAVENVIGVSAGITVLMVLHVLAAKWRARRLRPA